jgi:hypothetical protein
VGQTTSDEEAIRAVVQRWAVARDAGLWGALLDTWHPDGRMHTTWCKATAAEFVEAVRGAFESGLVVHHYLGGTMVEVSGDRAIAQSKTTIANRVTLDGVECDLLCWGRFYDFFERRDGRWAIVLRLPIYEKDRVDVVMPGATLDVDQELLASFPSGCRWLLYAQHKAGLPIITEQAGVTGELVERIYAAGAIWLAGGPAPAA